MKKQELSIQVEDIPDLDKRLTESQALSEDIFRSVHEEIEEHDGQDIDEGKSIGANEDIQVPNSE